jgi:integrase
LGRKFSNRNACCANTPLSPGISVTGTPGPAHYDWCHTASSQYVAQTRFDTVRNFSLFRPCRGTRPRSARRRLRPGAASTPDPDIIEPEQIRAIMQPRRWTCRPRHDQPHTYHYLFGLLAATGLRISEALALQCNDLVEDGLIVRNGKFGKQRLIALQPSTRQALEAYLATRASTRHGQ